MLELVAAGSWAAALGLVLPARLQAVYDAIPPGSRVADIGCDHGQLSAALAISGRAKATFACDISEHALAKAASTLRAAGCGDGHGCVQLRQGDGLSSLLSDDDVDTVVMAGLGVARMVSILRAPVPFPVQNILRTVVLQPVQELNIFCFICTMCLSLIAR